MYARTDDTVEAVAQFLAFGDPATGLTVTAKVWELRSDGSKVPNDTTGTTASVSEIGGGGYRVHHTMVGDGVPIFVLSTAGTADQSALMTGAFSIATLATADSISNLNDFDPANDTVVNVTNVATVAALAEGVYTAIADAVSTLATYGLQALWTLIDAVGTAVSNATADETTAIAAVCTLLTDTGIKVASNTDKTGYEGTATNMISGFATEAKQDAAKTVLDTVALDVAGLDGDPMRGTDDANTVAPDNAGIVANAGKLDTLVARNYPLTSVQTQTAAAAALTAYDPPTRTEATADKAEIIAEIEAAIGVEGFGDDACTLTIRNTGGTAVIADAQVYVGDDATPTNRTRTKVTNSLGQVSFDLTAGDVYYAWVFHDDYTGTNPTAFTASAD